MTCTSRLMMTWLFCQVVLEEGGDKITEVFLPGGPPSAGCLEVFAVPQEYGPAVWPGQEILKPHQRLGDDIAELAFVLDEPQRPVVGQAEEILDRDWLPGLGGEAPWVGSRELAQLPVVWMPAGEGLDLVSCLLVGWVARDHPGELAA